MRDVSDLVDDYDYELPPGATAQVPAERRDQARLLLVERFAAEAPRPRPAVSGSRLVADLPSFLGPGDLLVVNDVHVMAARLVARRDTGGRVSVLVLRVAEGGRGATVLLGARGTIREGELLELAGDTWRVCRVLGQGRFEVQVSAGRDLHQLMADVGRMPLPPYISRDAEADARDALDRERYRTTFAAPQGAAVAAPTAGLHLTSELLAACERAGARLARLRLDVGEGTFRPLRGERLGQHEMHEESYVLPEATANAFARTRAAGGRVVAVGTTVVRALESAVAADGQSLAAGEGSTRIFLAPGHRFSAVDALLTNFHQPRSTLLVLVSAFAGRATIAQAYAQALAEGFRFFSYGDAMLLQGQPLAAASRPASAAGQAPATGPR